MKKNIIILIPAGLLVLLLAVPLLRAGNAHLHGEQARNEKQPIAPQGLLFEETFEDTGHFIAGMVRQHPHHDQ